MKMMREMRFKPANRCGCYVTSTFLAAALFVAGTHCLQAQAEQQQQPDAAHSPSSLSGPSVSFPTVLYGAAYYHEYMPYDRLDKDVAMMKAAGLNVVRMGESTWSLWEPEDGHFEYAWMDRVVDAMGKAGIKVILGTPTYSVPAWMAHRHPEILARRMNGGPRYR
jgi:beta-glucosidase/6-phospho-beta-glucosidase/beta-galactosidase